MELVMVGTAIKPQSLMSMSQYTSSSFFVLSCCLQFVVPRPVEPAQTFTHPAILSSEFPESESPSSLKI